MTWMAYSHPEFTEELALLSPDLRIGFYAQVMTQGTKGPLSPPLDFYFPHASDSKLGLHTRFHYLGHQPKFLLSLDTKVKQEGFVYLHLAADKDDNFQCQTAIKRLEDIASGHVEPVNLDKFLREEADKSEYKSAIKINSDIANCAINQYLLEEAFKEAKDEAAIIFNLCAPQMERLLIRFDYFLGSFQEKLRHKGACAGLEIAFKGSPPRVYPNLKEFLQK